MQAPANERPYARFGEFEVDLRSGELRHDGAKVKLQEKPFQILLILLEHPGEVVTREEFRQRLWPEGTFVDFEHSINVAIKKLREALGDCADKPRFIETLPRHGYRFIAPVEGGAVHELPPLPMPDASQATPTTQRPLLVRRSVLALLVLAVIGATLVARWLIGPSPYPRVLRAVQLSHDGREKVDSMTTDGLRLYLSEVVGGHLTPVALPTSGGEAAVIPTPLQDVIVRDISPDGSELLVTAQTTPTGEGSLWAIPVLGGAPRRLGNAWAQDAVWSPDGKVILYVRGPDLVHVKADGSESRRVASAPGVPGYLHWSPDGTRISVTVVSGKAETLWELSRDGSNLHPRFPGRCGEWAPDGKYFLFLSNRSGVDNVWLLPERKSFFQKRSAEPIQLTAMPFGVGIAIPSKDGRRIFALAAQTQGELLCYDVRSRQFAPYLSGISADGIDFSKDGAWVTYVSVPEGALWRSRLDGGERLKLTSAPLQAFLPRWSPSGKQIAFMGKQPGEEWGIYVVPAEGGSVQALTHGNGEADAGWSPDGSTIVFADMWPYLQPPKIYLTDLTTGKVSTVSGSEGLHSPRWSPDGRYIAALRWASEDLWLFDVAARKWTEVAKIYVGFPTWSHDSKYIYFDAPKNQGFYRVRIGQGELQQVLSLMNLRLTGNLGLGWTGLTPDDSPLVLRSVGAPEIYALDWEAP